MGSSSSGNSVREEEGLEGGGSGLKRLAEIMATRGPQNFFMHWLLGGLQYGD